MMNQTLNDSVNRFENGRLTDSMGRVFTVRTNTAGANFTVDVNDLAGGVQPALGAFSLVDDDLMKDGDDVPMPDTGSLTTAMSEAYVNVLFDLVGSYNEVPFVLNVATGQLAQIVSDNWSTRLQNAPEFWIAYVAGAFQGLQSGDNDANNEITTFGATGNPGGGSLIYIESNRDAAVEAGVSVAVYEQDLVVHEVGHAVANSGSHPVTGGDTNPVGTFSKYTPDYIAHIRSALKPWGGA